MDWDAVQDIAWIGVMVGFGLSVQDPHNPYATWFIGVGLAVFALSVMVPRRPLQGAPVGGWRSHAGAIYITAVIVFTAALCWMFFRPSTLSIAVLLVATVGQILLRRALFRPKGEG
jgi:apolipoprotein N-acyltransferase